LASPVRCRFASFSSGAPTFRFSPACFAGPNQPQGVRTEFDRRLARRRPPAGAASPTHVRGGGGAGFGVQERVLNPTGSARAQVSGS
jgi:hypothetical protein